MNHEPWINLVVVLCPHLKENAIGLRIKTMTKLDLQSLGDATLFTT